MPEFVRATDPVSGAEVTVTSQRAKTLNLKVLDKPATGPYGHALPAQPAPPASVPAESENRAVLEAYAVDHGMTREQAQSYPNKGELYAAITKES